MLHRCDLCNILCLEPIGFGEHSTYPFSLFCILVISSMKLFLKIKRRREKEFVALGIDRHPDSDWLEV